jgi:hypothetical protein
VGPAATAQAQAVSKAAVQEVQVVKVRAEPARAELVPVVQVLVAQDPVA